MRNLLYVKTNYTLLTSLIKIDEIINYAKEHNYSYCSIVDDNMFKVMDFYNKCLKNNLKPIIGLEVKDELGVILLYPVNYLGYQNLIKIANITYERPITYDELNLYKNNLIAIVNNTDLFNIFKDVFPKLFLGYSNYEEEQAFIKITDNVILLNKLLYLKEDDKKYLKYILMMRDSKTIDDEIILPKENELDESNLSKKNVDNLVNMVNIIFPKYDLLLPIYKTPNDIDSFKYLFFLSKKGLEKRLNNIENNLYLERLKYELSVIKTMGFANYFLVVYDYINYAKKNNILVGPGRGSAAGSLVAYSLGITDVDPIKYNLLFERFLNVDRVTFPDIDTDFPDNKRDEVINYVVNKYGKDCVAGIVTFGTLGNKGAIRDVGRILNISLIDIDLICKYIPNTYNKSLIDLYKESKDFQYVIDKKKEFKKLLQIATYFEGFPRHTSSHAAGIVITDKPLDNYIPLIKSDGVTLTAYSMEHLEDIGILKMDFLGLKNLTIIANIIEDVKNDLQININFSDIPLDCTEALKIFETADTTGIFQFESTGMRNFIRRLKPNCFEDVIAAIALFRPGPADNIDSYIKRKHNEEKIDYIDESIKEILLPTYGIIIYQEQIMQVASSFAGYSLKEADLLRRAMSKKKKELLTAEEERFIKNSMNLNHSYEKSKEVFELILKFANYGFNRSHSVAYSIISYKMAYLKVKYPECFYANLLTNVIGSTVKTKEYIDEIKSKDIKILNPDINLSYNNYVVSNLGIRYPLSNIKNIGFVSANEIINKRGSGYIDIFDFINKTFSRNINRKTIETLIYAKAFASFGYNTKTLINNLDKLINYGELSIDLDPSLIIKPNIVVCEDYPIEILSQKEFDIFGFYINSHPTMIYKSKFNNIVNVIDINNYYNRIINIIVIVDNMKKIRTKNNDEMAFITGSDNTSKVELIVFPKVLENYSFVNRGSIIKVIGKVEKRFDKIQVIVNSMERVDVN